MFNAEQISNHIFNITGIKSCVLDTVKVSNNVMPDYCKTCGACGANQKHFHSAKEAERWGNKFIYYCDKSFIFIATQNKYNSKTLITGPIVMEESEFDSFFLPVLSTKAVGSVSEIIYNAFSFFIEDEKKLTKSEILNSIYNNLDDLSLASVSIEYENELETAILMGNKSLVKETINNIICHILLESAKDFTIIKSRTIEFIVLLSRSIIKSGVNSSLILRYNAKYIKEIDLINDMDDLSEWLISVVHNYMTYVPDLENVKHKAIITKICNYIKSRFTEKLTLQDVSSHVYLSPSYLSKLIKDELKCSFTDYINNLRVEKSKEFLLSSNLSLSEIACVVGFEDQSYFTKVFKKFTGISPGRYKDRIV